MKEQSEKEFIFTVRKSLDLTSNKTMTKSSGVILYSLIRTYLKEAVHVSSMYADRQDKDVVDAECVAEIEESLVQTFI